MKKIKFVPTKGLEHILAPTPLKNHIPKWYKDGEMYDNNGGAALKTCVPFFRCNAFRICPNNVGRFKNNSKRKTITIEDGDIQPDGSFVLKGKQHDHAHKIKGNQIRSMIINERTSTSGSTIPRPAGHLQNHFIWSGKWGMQVPRGYFKYL